MTRLLTIAAGLSSLRDGAATRLHPDGLQSTGAADAATALLSALRARLPGFTLEEIHSRRWASVTFAGARHDLTFRLEGEDAETVAGRFISGLHARDFPTPGHLLADLTLVSEERRPGLARIKLEALTVEDA